MIISFILRNNFTSIKIYEILYDIFLGVFGSSFVVLLITIPEYKTAKVQTLEKIWVECDKILNSVAHIKPLISKYDEELLENCLNEWLFNNNSLHSNILGIQNKYSNNLKNIMKIDYMKNYKKLNKTELKKILDDDYNYEITKLKEDIEKRMKEYYAIKKISLIKLNELLGDVQFITGKKNMKRLYDDVYKPLYDIIKNTKVKICSHIDVYYQSKGDGRIDVLYKLIRNFQKKLFKVNISTKENDVFESYYNDFVDKYTENIDKFKFEVIYSEKAPVIEKYPVITIHKFK